MLEEWELKIHQSSHARYFEDFLKYVEYNRSMVEIIRAKVVETAQQYIAEAYEEDSEERAQEKESIEAWSNTPERQLQEKWTTEQVVEASSPIIDHQPEVELKQKLDHMEVKALLSDFSENLHIAKVNGKYVILIEGEAFSFDKSASLVEFFPTKPSAPKLPIN
ncbi:DUF3898 domain-containing protein [Salipaludibacillus neizhouensis]|nr:DUF3898 domain-containing protein [Salipaludibacillus neizhouensis]